MGITIVLYLIGVILMMAIYIAYMRSHKNEYLSLGALIGYIILSMLSWVSVIIFSFAWLFTDGRKVVVYRFKYKER